MGTNCPSLAALNTKTLPCRNSKKESDLNLAQARLRDLDAQLNAKEADLATALNENRTLENELCELKDQVLSVRLAIGIYTLLLLLQFLLDFSQLLIFKSRGSLAHITVPGRQKDFHNLADSKCY